MKRLLPLTVLGLSLACGGLLEPQTHTSDDGRFQLTAPASFRSAPDLHPQAVLALQRSVPEGYVLVLADERADVVEGMSFEERSLNIRNQTAETMADVSFQEPVSTTIDGHPAMKMRFDGKLDGLDLGYLQTTVLTDQAFVQVVIWGMRERVEGDAELEAIAESFVQVGPGDASWLASQYGTQPSTPFRSTEHTRVSIDGGPWNRAPQSENPDASLYLTHERLDIALLIISEPIDESEIGSLEEFSQITTERMGPAMGATRYQLADPVPFEAGGLPGLLVVMDADVEGYRFEGLHLSVRGAERYHQVWTWGPRSQIERHQDQLKAALASFQEL